MTSRLSQWAHDTYECATKIRSARNVWDWFIAFFVPRWWLRFYRKVRYGRWFQ